MRIPTTEQIRDLESSWIAHCDQNWGQVLMEIAGRGAAIHALRLWQENPGDVVIVIGKGNNGGDGLVIARYLTLWEVPVSVWLVSGIKIEGEKQAADPESKSKKSSAAKSASPSSKTAEGDDVGNSSSSKSGTALKEPGDSDNEDSSNSDEEFVAMKTNEGTVNRNILESLNVPVTVVTEDILGEGDRDNEFGDFVYDPNVDELFDNASLIVDALFGTGLSKPVEGLYRRVIDAINRSGKRVLAIDVPSGINSDTGQIMGSAVRADHTVTFGYLKPGLVTHPGATLAGQLGIVDIGLPELPESTPDINLMTVEIVKEILPLRPADSHKGSFGHVLTIAGSPGMGGAAMLASKSALRVGAGMVFLATPRTVMNTLPPEEIIYRPMPETDSGSFSRDAIKPLKEQMATAQAVILGPGLGLTDDTQAIVADILHDIECPCIIDADGLNAIAKKPELLENNEGDFVLTPHPKELARLLNCEVAEIQSDRIGYALKAAEKFQSVVVLKGSMTVVANPEGQVFINPTGNPGMSTAGAGDVLSGIIGGLLAQGVESFHAAAAGVYIHGRAGDILAEEIAECGIVAGDIQRTIPFAIESIQDDDRSDLETMLLTNSTD